MSKKEMLRLNVSHDMKKGIKLLFKGQRINQAFEAMLEKYISDIRNFALEDEGDAIMTLDGFLSRGAGSRAIERAQERVFLAKEKVEHYTEIRNLCFPPEDQQYKL